MTITKDVLNAMYVLIVFVSNTYNILLCIETSKLATLIETASYARRDSMDGMRPDAWDQAIITYYRNQERRTRFRNMMGSLAKLELFPFEVVKSKNQFPSNQIPPIYGGLRRPWL